MPEKLTTEIFVSKARAIHGDYYDYSQVVYVNKSTPVTILCPVHDKFQQKPSAHLYEKNACRSCTWRRKYPINPAQTPEAQLKRRLTCQERYGAEHPLTAGTISRGKRDATCLDKYGTIYPMENSGISRKVSNNWKKKTAIEKEELKRKRFAKGNPFANSDVKKAIKSTRTNLGQWTPDAMLSDLNLFRRNVWQQTNKTYRANIDKIDPNRLRGTEFHLDHKIPITIGFREGLSVDNVSSVENLQIIGAQENLSKGNRYRD